VITKVGYINNVFRTFDFEVLAGEENFETTQNEDGLKFMVNPAAVYWCSRLAGERSRVALQFFRPGEVLLDMFCGIGPMAIKAWKEADTLCLASDLNPDCYHYLRKNIVLNKCADSVVPFCMDAREFALHVIEQSNNKDIPDFVPQGKPKHKPSAKQ
jgi:tRNA (guanine37-N1)-methyltransferase